MTRATRWFPAGLALAFGVLVLPDPALGHAELTSPQPRSPGPKMPQPGWIPGQGTNPGTASDGCGLDEVPRTSQPTVVTAGSNLEIHWKETINHIGWFEFQFSPAGDTGWLRLILVADTNDGGVSPENPKFWSTVTTLPSTPTTTGTLRLISWALGGGPPPEPPPFTTMLHVSCADLELRPDALFADGFE